MLRKAGEERRRRGAGRVGGRLELDPAERALIKKLLAFPAEVAEAAERRAPHRIATYALELAQTFTAFYRDCHVVGAEPEALESFRIGLCVASKRTIARSLDLLGVARRTRCSYSSQMKSSPRPSSACWASLLSCVSSPVSSSTPMAIRTTPEIAVTIR